MDEIYKRNSVLLNRILKNSFFLCSSRIIDIASVIITTPIVARYLGLSGFGDYALAMAFSIFIKPLADFGFERIICRDISKDKKNANKYISTAVVNRVLISAFIIVAIYILLELVGFNRDLKLAIYISAISELMLSFCTIFLAVIKAYERMEYELICSFIHKIIFVSSILLVIIFDMGFLSLFYARLFSSIIFLLVSIFIVYKQLVEFMWKYSRRITKFILKEGYPLAIFSFLLTFSFKMDVFFLKYFKGASEVALFEASHRLIMQMQFIPMAITFAIFPFLSQMSEQKNESLRSYYKKTARAFYIFSIFPIILMIVGSEEIICLLFGRDFIASSTALKILASTFIFLVFVTLQHNMLIIKGKQILNLFSVCACFLSKALLDFIFVPLYGYIGASVATLISYFILFSFTAYFVLRNIGKINISGIILKPTICAVLSGLACRVMLNFYTGIPSLFICIFLGTAIYIVALLMLKTLSDDEMETVKRVLFKRRFR